MGYVIYVFDKDKRIMENDFDEALKGMNQFNREGLVGVPPVDISIKEKYIRLSGSHSLSGKYAVHFTLDLVLNLIKLGFKPMVHSEDFGFLRDIEAFQNL